LSSARSFTSDSMVWACHDAVSTSLGPCPTNTKMQLSSTRCMFMLNAMSSSCSCAMQYENRKDALMRRMRSASCGEAPMMKATEAPPTSEKMKSCVKRKVKSHSRVKVRVGVVVMR
jgi:hypothetical protein